MTLYIKHIKSFLLVSALLIGIIAAPAYGQRDGRKNKSKNRQDNSALFMEANTQKLLGNYDVAYDLFLKCLTADPGDAASMYELARIARIKSKTEKAIDWAETATKIDKKNVWYLKLLAELYQENMQFDKSIEVMEQLVELNPTDLEYLYDLALSHLLVGNYQKSIDVYNIIEEQIGVTEEISIQKQKIWLRLKKPDKAIEEVENLCAAWPTDSRLKSILAELYLANDMDEKALATYLDIAEQDPNNTYIQISLSDYYRKRGDHKKSFEHLKTGFTNPYLDLDTKVQILLAYFTAKEYYEDQKEEAEELATILVETHPLEAKAHSIQADLYYQAEEWENARTSLRKVLSLDSSNYVVWEQLLFTESNLEDFEAMRDESKTTIELFPQQPLPYLFSAVANYQFEDHEQMIKDLERGKDFVVRNDLLLAEFYTYLGDAYHQVGEDEKAYKAYDASLKINSDNPLVLNNYAYYLSLEGKELDRAKKMAKKSNELDPDNASNQDTYGWVLYMLGDYEAALEWIGMSVKNHGTANSEVLEHYGDTLYKLGREKEALKYWKKALDADNGGTEFLKKKVADGTLYE